jgi:large subunit ribosomal protein L5
VAFPRTKDFRGLVKKGIDTMGNYSIGIKENTIFPETADEDEDVDEDDEITDDTDDAGKDLTALTRHLRLLLLLT